MGMDYKFAGSASYPRFSEELGKIAGLFGAIELPSEERQGKDRFVFDENTKPELVKFFNDPYNENFTYDETVVIFNEFQPLSKQIGEISWQIFHEICSCIMEEEPWYIY